MTEIETMLSDALDELSRLHASTMSALEERVRMLDECLKRHDERLRWLEGQATFSPKLLSEQARRLEDLTKLLDDFRRQLDA